MGKLHRILKRARKLDEFRQMALELQAAGVDLKEVLLSYSKWPHTNRQMERDMKRRDGSWQPNFYSAAFVLAHLQHVGFYRICRFCMELEGEFHHRGLEHLLPPIVFEERRRYPPRGKVLSPRALRRREVNLARIRRANEKS